MRIGHVSDNTLAAEFWRRVNLRIDQHAPFGGFTITAVRRGELATTLESFSATDEALAEEVYRRVKRTGGELGVLVICITRGWKGRAVAKRWGVDGHVPMD